MKIDKPLMAKLFLLVAVSAAGAYYAQPLIHKNKDAADVLVNVFSILAGFLVAVMTIIGEPVFYKQKSWRFNKISRNNYRKSLVRHKDLFHAYLVTLALIFSSRLINENDFPCLQLWLERSFLFFALIAFCYSLRLPDKLMAKQLEKFDDQIEDKKQG